MKRTGFTLAEVLITLGIIGVIAAMTLPTLLVNKQKSEFVEKTKKVYSTLEQTIKLAENDNGNRSSWTYGTSSYNGDEAVTFANTYLIPYMSVAKNCGKNTGCWVTQPKKFDGTNGSYSDSSGYAKFVLNDGTAIHVTTFTTWVFIHFDINGPTQGPNIYGQDILTYIIYQNLSNPVYGINWDRATIVNPSSSNGCSTAAAQADTCLALIIKDGWKISDDYPWN